MGLAGLCGASWVVEMHEARQITLQVLVVRIVQYRGVVRLSLAKDWIHSGMGVFIIGGCIDA